MYPRVACSAAGKKVDNDNMIETIDTKSPEYIITACELETFKEIVNSKTQFWRQKKRLLEILKENSDYFQSIEQKLITGAVLTPKEQATYESNSGCDVEKISWLQSEVKKMVDEGQLTSTEKDELLKSIDASIAAVVEEQTVANTENKPKKVEKLEEKKQALLTRKLTVQKIEPIRHRLKHGDEVQKLRCKVYPLVALEDKGRSLSLTLSDLKALEEKSDFEATILSLEAASRGWWQTDEDFEAMCKFEEKEAKAKYNAKVKAQAAKKPTSGGGGGGPSRMGGGSSAGGAWSTSNVKKSGSGLSSSAPKKSGGGFAAAFGNDSDSD